ncbi:alpha-2-macroglobulin family protein [Profundicola chukchiensis]|uniref:alpha-2-macroglobulin family protein n=1 Tax=Profundicola chukchiensis TaxID=2961959 RepID=UPI0026F3F825|nr:alpha-2-macroglobulin family protein [Profundicola chukchiensis]
MRKFFIIFGMLLICIPTMAQKYPFKAKWDNIQNEINSGKTKSLAPLLDEIYLEAKKANQSADLIKALLFKSRIAIETSDDENVVLETEQQIQNEIDNSDSVQKAVLQSVLAELYFNYYNENYYRIHNRTNVNENSSKDFRAWSTEQYLNKIDEQLQASLSNQNKLFATNLNSIDLLLYGSDAYRFLQPTIYDILAKRALQLYTNQRFNAQEFNQTIKEEKIDEIYSQLIKLHQSDKDKSALIQSHLDKIDYSKSKNADFNLIEALTELDQQYQSEPWSTRILSGLAQEYRNQGDLVKAMEIAKEAQMRAPDSFGASEAKIIQQEIEMTQLSFSTDDSFYADQHNPLSISHTNVDKIFYRVYKLTPDQLAKNPNGFEYNYKTKKLKIVGELKLQNSVDLKKFKDYKSHTTHIPFPAIEAGNFVILISNNDNFEGKINHHLFQAPVISTKFDIASRNRANESESFKEVQLLDKNTGLPLKNKKVDFLQSIKNGPFTTLKTFTTDDLGRLELKSIKRDYNSQYALQFKDDQAIHPLDTYSYHSYSNKQEDTWKNEIKIFTDRAIYRPGQTVYFKAILYQTKGKERRIAKNEPFEVVLNDPNYEDLAKLNLTSNEFGSAHGEFVLPSSGLTGRFTFENKWSPFSAYSISVEEYKRPKFQVKLDTLAGVYKLNQKVEVSGNASTFSGANVSDAKVVYRVFRKSYNPYGWWWRWYDTEEVDMTSGETKTDKDGAFKFDFNALPKENEKAGKRAYVYRIVADITDISGETHSVEGSVRIGDLPLTLRIETPERVSVDGFNKIKLISQNLNGVDTDATGSFSITKIKPQDRVLRHSQDQVDYELIDKNEFIKKLPYIAYDNEHLIENRERLNTVLTSDWDTSNSQEVTWENKIPAGFYELKATSIIENDSIETIKIIEVYDSKLSSNQNIYFDASLKKNSLKPGDTAEIEFISDAKDAHVLVELEVDGKIIKKEILKLNNAKTFKFPIKEEYRGGVYVHAYFSKFNESIYKRIDIQVPYTNKELDISVETLRDKLKPGEEETWTLNIKDKVGDKFLAEVLVGMYDKSLDEFVANPYEFTVYNANYSSISSWEKHSGIYFRDLYHFNRLPRLSLSYEDISLFGLNLNEYNLRNQVVAVYSLRSPEIESMAVRKELSGEVAEVAAASDAAAPAPAEEVADEALSILKDGEDKNLGQIEARKNLQETAFFFPNLKTDADGNLKIEFTTPESLTQWNFQAVAHTQDLKIGTFQADIVTQKELMVVPNAPRFLREGDEVIFNTKIINLSDKDLSGDAQLMLFDAFSMQPIEAKFNLNQAQQSFDVEAGGNSSVSWTLQIPNVDEVQSVVYRVVAGTGEFSDGEENALPILTNRMMVTETMPIHVRENQSKTFTFDKLVNTTSATRDNFKLTMEMTTNPIWYAVMALPYLREYPYDCSEQVFARLYGNLISQSIVNSNPKIKAVFDDWNRKGQLISPLEENQELKNILLEETPWVRDAQSETEQMKRIAVLFDLNKMRNELNDTYRKLEQKQSENGGFAWFEGGKENIYITTHIVAGFGHLAKMGIGENSDISIDLESIPDLAIEFIDNEMEKKWDKFQADKKRYFLSDYDGLYWLYARSFFLESHPLNNKLSKAKDYFLTELDKEKYDRALNTQALLALTLHRFGHEQKAKDLVFSIKDRSVESGEMGMYWKENVSGYRWFEAPVETQALLIEAFDEITPKDIESVESMKVWLLKNKQTNQWNSTKATTEAVYALMNTGKDWTNAEDGIEVKVGNNIWYDANTKPSTDVQSGSGYIKESWSKGEITPEMGKVEVEKTSPGVAWGAMYWQYFEDLDKITNAETNVKFKKQLFIQKNTPQGPKLFEITENAPIEIGDLVKVRLEIQTDRAMEFVHIKDMRASGFEPVNVLSSFKWQDGLGYYESTRDAATNFFIDYLPKGVYVFEYDLRANNAGSFSNGITQLQNMYAPEFTAHSDGMNIQINQ